MPNIVAQYSQIAWSPPLVLGASAVLRRCLVLSSDMVVAVTCTGIVMADVRSTSVVADALHQPHAPAASRVEKPPWQRRQRQRPDPTLQLAMETSARATSEKAVAIAPPKKAEQPANLARCTLALSTYCSCRPPPAPNWAEDWETARPLMSAEGEAMTAMAPPPLDSWEEEREPGEEEAEMEARRTVRLPVVTKIAPPKRGAEQEEKAMLLEGEGGGG